MEALSGPILVIVLFLIFAAIALPLIVWRIKDVLLEIRDELRQQRKPGGSA